MRGLGSELTQGDRVGGRGSKLADSQGKPMLADGEEGGEQEYKEININEPIFMEQGEFTKNADDWCDNFPPLFRWAGSDPQQPASLLPILARVAASSPRWAIAASSAGSC